MKINSSKYPPLGAMIKKRLLLSPDDAEGVVEPEETTEETTEEEEDVVVSFDELEDENFVPSGKIEEAEEEEEEAEEETEEEEVVEEEEETIEEEPAPATNARNYDELGLNEEELAAVKKLKNFPFNQIKPILIERRKQIDTLRQAEAKVKEFEELQGGKLPDNFYQHPEAYKLSPKYQEAAMLSDTCALERRHYEAQYAALEEGQPAKMIVGYSAETGEPVYGEEITGAMAKAKINSALLNVNTAAQRASSELANLQQSYSKEFTEASDLAKSIGSALVERLPEKVRPKMEDIQKIQKEIIPPAFADHPLAESVAGALTIIQLVSADNQALRDELEKQRKLGNDEELAGPKPKKLKKSAKSNKDADFVSFNDLEEETKPVFI